MQGLSLLCSPKIRSYFEDRFSSLVIRKRGFRDHWSDLQQVLDWQGWNREFISSHPTIEVISFLEGIREEFPNQNIMHLYCSCEKRSPSTVSKHIRYERVFKKPKVDFSFHNNHSLLIEVHECLKCIFISKAMLFVSLSLKRYLGSGSLLEMLTKRNKHKPYTKVATNLIKCKLVQKPSK